MLKAIGAILPLALGVAISPIPIIAVILMLLSPKASTNGPAFVVGWVSGLAAVSIAVSALSGKAGLGSGSCSWVWRYANSGTARGRGSNPSSLVGCGLLTRPRV